MTKAERKAEKHVKMAIAELRVDNRESYRLPLASFVGQAMAYLKKAVK